MIDNIGKNIAFKVYDFALNYVFVCTRKQIDVDIQDKVNNQLCFTWFIRPRVRLEIFESLML